MNKKNGKKKEKNKRTEIADKVRRTHESLIKFRR